MVFGPARSRPVCDVHLGGVPPPVVTQYRYLGVVLTPDLSWRAHVAHVSSRGDRLFHQSSAWCHGEGLPVSFAVSVFDTYILSSAKTGLEFVGDDAAAIAKFNLALRRWCRQLLGGAAPRRSLPSTGKLALVTLCVWSSAEHFRFLAVCAPWTMVDLALLCPQPFSGFVPTSGALGPTGALQLCAHCQFLSPASLESLLVRRRWPSLGGALGKFVLAWIVTSITDWQPWQLTSMGSGWTLHQTLVYPSATTRSTPGTSRSLGLGYGDLLDGATTPLLQVGPRVT